MTTMATMMMRVVTRMTSMQTRLMKTKIANGRAGTRWQQRKNEDKDEARLDENSDRRWS
jgi:hypothetical protein